MPSGDVDWKTAIRRSAISAHQVLLRHPWASSLIESRVNAGPARLRYLDAVIGVLSAAGFTMPMVMRAIMALDSHTYGFVLQELAWPFDVEHAPEVAATFARGLPAGEYPNLLAMAEMVTTAPARRPGRFRVRAGPDPRRPRAAPGPRAVNRSAYPSSPAKMGVVRLTIVAIASATGTSP